MWSTGRTDGLADDMVWFRLDIPLNLMLKFFFWCHCLCIVSLLHGAATKCCSNFWIVLDSLSRSTPVHFLYTCSQSKCSFLTWQFLSLNCAFNFYVGTVSICDNSLWKLFCGMTMMLQILLPWFKYRCFIFTNGRKNIDLRWINGTLREWGCILKKIMKNQYFDSHNESAVWNPK